MPFGATCDAICYGTPDGVRTAGFDTADTGELVSVEVELVVDTPLGVCRAVTAGLPLIRWTVA